MLRKALFTTAAALMMAPMAFAQPTPVQEVKVTADITAIDNAEAAKYWTNVATDLQNALLARLVDRTADKGSKISIDIDELSLANSFQNKLGLEDSLLAGSVAITSDVDNAKFDGYELAVSAKAAQAFSKDGQPLAGSLSDAPQYYDALINAFADGVVSRLK